MPTRYNQFELQELGISTTITVPVGSYNKNNLMTTLATLLTAGSVTLGNNWVYSVAYPATTGPDTFKYTFTVTGNTGQPSFIFSDSSPFRQLGFDQSSTNTFSANTLISTNAINLSYILRIFIKSNVCSSNDGNLEEILSAGSFPPLSIIYYQQYNFDMNTKVFSSENINSWNFIAVDSYGQEIDFNNVPWAFTLVFYQRNNTHQIHKQDLLISNEQRLFDIEQQQTKIQQTVLGEDTTVPKPSYTTKPFGSSSIVDAFLAPEIQYPK